MFQVRLPDYVSHHAGAQAVLNPAAGSPSIRSTTASPRTTASKIQLRYRLHCCLTQLDNHWELTVPVQLEATYGPGLYFFPYGSFFKLEILLDFLRIFTASNNREITKR